MNELSGLDTNNKTDSRPNGRLPGTKNKKRQLWCQGKSYESLELLEKNIRKQQFPRKLRKSRNMLYCKHVIKRTRLNLEACEFSITM
jgi:hypothetical protein